MDDVILKIENLSKQYRLGTVGTGTLSHDLNRWWHQIQGKEDPYLKVGESNDRAIKGTSEYVWALKDINLEVKKGEVLGIIGKNGAGKSTLLKILSKVTGPTAGSIKSKGRIASLLEVGTGFHPELTGKENIYLNGAILGMTRAEINLKYNEIVEFSGCERYIDTPVKRYSSGMRVRLAFAVAAFLEPDILVVDEVLAVGDAEFQKKAIGKMQDISRGEGRTVLFVSHNMAAVKDLCNRLLIIDNGMVNYNGKVLKGVSEYLSMDKELSGIYNFDNSQNENRALIEKLEIRNKNEEISNCFLSGEEMIFYISIKILALIRNPVLSLRISDFNNTNVITWRSNDYIKEPIPKFINDSFKIIINSRDLYLMDGFYQISIGLADGKEVLDKQLKVARIEVTPSKPNKNFHYLTKEKSTNSLIYSEAKWSYEAKKH